MKSLRSIELTVYTAVLAILFAGAVIAQEPIGGPYTTDANTVLLLHLDGNFTNESSFSDDAIGHGNFVFFPASADASLDQSLRLDNDAEGDSSHATVADNDNLDLTGDWTIEGWINVFTFGAGAEDWRWVPRLIIKTGDEVFWRPNYWIEMWGDNRFFSFGYHNSQQNAWPQVNTPNNFMEPGVWYHLAFIRDNTQNVMINMIHNAQRELMHFGAVSYDPIEEDPPLVSTQDVHIGWAGSIATAGGPSGDSWLDGFVDEIRVSNIVRNFTMPLAIVNATTLEDQDSSVPSYPVNADVLMVGAAGAVQSVTLNYSTDGGITWQTIPMTAGSTTYSAEIPGQPLDTVVDYYILAEDDGGLQSTSPSGALSHSAYYSFSVFAAPEAVGGPYTADANTMLLLHLDGNFTNESDSSDDAIGHGNFLFFPASADASLDQSLRLDNDAEGDSSHATVADNDNLDLTGDWTIEGWINVFTFGAGAEDWRWVPRLIIKTGDEVFWRPNYWIEMWGDNRFFSFGYHNSQQNAWPQVNTPNNFMEPGVWYHLAFIRDNTQNVMINMIHNAQRELMHFGAVSYDPIEEDPPLVSTQDVHIGWAGSIATAGGPSGDSWLDGFVDEIRVSNIVRNFTMPLAIVNATTLEDQDSSVPSYPVNADVLMVGAAGAVQSVTLNYSTDGGITWQTIPMTAGSTTYSAEIPGQPLDTVVDYYILAEDDGGLQSTSPSGALSHSAYYSFSVAEPTGIEPVASGLPTTFELSQNFPNPFNPSTEIKFAIPKSQYVNLTVYDLFGRTVKTLVDEEVAAGRYKVSWEGTTDAGKQVASGIYFYRLQSKENVQARKMVLVR